MKTRTKLLLILFAAAMLLLAASVVSGSHNSTPTIVPATIEACLDTAEPYGECTDEDIAVENLKVTSIIDGNERSAVTNKDGKVKVDTTVVDGRLNFGWDTTQVITVDGKAVKTCHINPTLLWRDEDEFGMDFAISPGGNCNNNKIETEDT